MVSFPLKIIIVHEDGMKKKEMSEDDFFSFTFRSSNEKQYFIDNYEQINNDFKEFIEISKHDNELSAKSLSINTHFIVLPSFSFILKLLKPIMFLPVYIKHMGNVCFTN